MAMTVQRNGQLSSDADRVAVLANPGFGRYFTDHLVRIDWTRAAGWDAGAVLPYGPIPMDPGTSSLHYGQLIFEGLKAYQQADGTVAAFRPEMNAARFARSAARLAMPALPSELFLESLRALVEVDRAWVPTAADASLYLRPLMIASEVGLGVRPADAYSYYLIASPAGPYFPRGVQPVSVWLSTEYIRAGRSGRAGLRPGGLAGRRQPQLCGRDGRDEPLLRLRQW